MQRVTEEVRERADETGGTRGNIHLHPAEEGHLDTAEQGMAVQPLGRLRESRSLLKMKMLRADLDIGKRVHSHLEMANCFWEVIWQRV